jgi:hypothetical protein
MKIQRFYLYVSMVCILFIGGGVSLSFAQKVTPQIDVEIQIFSGMPNPNWLIDSSEGLEQMRSLIRGLPSMDEFDEPQFGAFLLSADESKCNFPQRVLVYAGKIKATTADGTVRFFEDAKGLDGVLRDQGIEKGFGEFLQ